MSEPYIGEIRIFGFDFAPRGWATCSGQIISIAQNTALFSILGTTYGGNGSNNFGLPDFRGRAPMAAGSGPGLTAYSLGEVTGEEAVTLLTSEMPLHTHSLQASADNALSQSPIGNIHATIAGDTLYRDAGAPTVQTPTSSIGIAGASVGHENRMPGLAMNICIALQGVFPGRN